jgi:hypothetical protein
LDVSKTALIQQFVKWVLCYLDIASLQVRLADFGTLQTPSYWPCGLGAIFTRHANCFPTAIIRILLPKSDQPISTKSTKMLLAFDDCPSGDWTTLAWLAVGKEKYRNYDQFLETKHHKNHRIAIGAKTTPPALYSTPILFCLIFLLSYISATTMAFRAISEPCH